MSSDGNVECELRANPSLGLGPTMRGPLGDPLHHRSPADEASSRRAHMSHEERRAAQARRRVGRLAERPDAGLGGGGLRGGGPQW